MAVYEFANFIENETCDLIVSRVEKDLKDCDILGEKIEKYRVAKGTWLEPGEEIAAAIALKLAHLTGYSVENQEKPHVVKYPVGGEYKIHHDFFHEGQNYSDTALSRGGQRTKSFLIYLNDDFEGGETEFPKLQLKVKPAKGKAVLWDNVTPDGKLDYDSLHAGLPVISGVKYILVIWVREERFV